MQIETTKNNVFKKNKEITFTNAKKYKHNKIYFVKGVWTVWVIIKRPLHVLYLMFFTSYHYTFFFEDSSELQSLKFSDIVSRNDFKYRNKFSSDLCKSFSITSSDSFW